MKTHLEPKEVLHLKELGVEFSNTTLQWVRPNLNDMPDENREEWARWQLSISFTDDEDFCEILPAPCLSEVLEKLPVCINVHNKYPSLQPYECDTFFFLIFDGVGYNMGYRQKNGKYEIIFSGSNILEMAVELLIDLANNNYLEKEVGNES